MRSSNADTKIEVISHTYNAEIEIRSRGANAEIEGKSCNVITE